VVPPAQQFRACALVPPATGARCDCAKTKDYPPNKLKTIRHKAPGWHVSDAGGVVGVANLNIAEKAGSSRTTLRDVDVNADLSLSVKLAVRR